MEFLTVNENRCTKCGLCARACPVGIIAVGKGLPVTIAKIEKGCITCGHCVAVCPSAALSHCRMTPDDCSPLAADWRPNPDQMEQLVRGRRSIRRYRAEPVERGILERIFEMVRYAPTGGNSQTVQWVVLSDPAEVGRLTSIVVDWLRILLAQGAPGVKGLLKSWELGEDPILRNAPALIIAHGVANYSMAKYSSTIALATLELAAVAFGLGACWAGFLHHAALNYGEVHGALGLPLGHQMHGGLMIGYPEFEYTRIPARKPAAVTWR